MRKSRLQNYILRGVNRSPIPALVSAYQARVAADAGSIDETTNNLTTLLRQLNGVVPSFTTSCKLFASPHLGSKQAAGTGGTAGNRAANKIYNIFGASGDLVQATAASQPLLLRNTGTNYAYLPGILGNFFSTPNAAANQITGDISFEAKFNCRANTVNYIIGKGLFTSLCQYALIVRGTTLELLLGQGGSVVTYTSNTNAIALNQISYVRVSRNSTTGIIKFFTSTNGVNFIQYGSDVAGFTGALQNPSVSLGVGQPTNASHFPFSGEIYETKIWNNDSFLGSPNVYFNPSNYSRSVSQTTWTSSTGEVWTINIDSNTTGLKAMICDKGLTVGNGSSYGMQAPSFNLNTGSFTSYKVYRKFNNSVVSIPFELSANAESNSGFYEAINGVPSCDGVGAFGNVGFNSTVFNSNNLLMKVTTFDWDSSRPNPESLYYINNAAATVNQAGGTANNTGNMNGTGYNLFARNNAASLWTNGVVFADLIFEGIHDTTTRTNVVNILKTYFNLP